MKVEDEGKNRGTGFKGFFHFVNILNYGAGSEYKFVYSNHHQLS